MKKIFSFINLSALLFSFGSLLADDASVNVNVNPGTASDRYQTESFNNNGFDNPNVIYDDGANGNVYYQGGGYYPVGGYWNNGIWHQGQKNRYHHDGYHRQHRRFHESRHEHHGHHRHHGGHHGGGRRR